MVACQYVKGYEENFVLSNDIMTSLIPYQKLSTDCKYNN